MFCIAGLTFTRHVCIPLTSHCLLYVNFFLLSIQALYHANAKTASMAYMVMALELHIKSF